MTDFEKEKIDELRKQNKGYYVIAKELNISADKVKYYLRKHDVLKMKRCLHCGKEVKQNPHRKQKLFCCNKCRMEWWKEHPEIINRKTHELICKQCGKKYSSRNKDSKYCSRKCYADARRKVE